MAPLKDSNITQIELVIVYVNRHNIVQKRTLVLENPTLMIEGGNQFVDRKGRGALMMTYDKATFRKTGDQNA